MTREQRIEKAEHIIEAAIKAIEQAAADAAAMRDMLPKYESCYTMQELDHVQKECDKASVKCNALWALRDEIDWNRESVKALDICTAWYFFPKTRAALTRHITAACKKTGETLTLCEIHTWMISNKCGRWMNDSDYYTLRNDYKTAFATYTYKVKKGA